MIVLNFSHPLTPDQVTQVEVLTKKKVKSLIELSVQFDDQHPYPAQLAGVMDKIPLTPQEWQSTPILVNLPSLNSIAVLVLAELHGRMGYFPPVLRMRPVEASLPPQYELAEILDLQGVRAAARTKRWGLG